MTNKNNTGGGGNASDETGHEGDTDANDGNTGGGGEGGNTNDAETVTLSKAEYDKMIGDHNRTAVEYRKLKAKQKKPSTTPSDDDDDDDDSRASDNASNNSRPTLGSDKKYQATKLALEDITKERDTVMTQLERAVIRSSIIEEAVKISTNPEAVYRLAKDFVEIGENADGDPIAVVKGEAVPLGKFLEGYVKKNLPETLKSKRVPGTGSPQKQSQTTQVDATTYTKQQLIDMSEQDYRSLIARNPELVAVRYGDD